MIQPPPPPQIVSLPPPVPPQQPNMHYKREAIPGLDFDDEELRRRKAPYSKPIPKEFEKAWKSNKPVPSTATSMKIDMDSHS